MIKNLQQKLMHIKGINTIVNFFNKLNKHKFMPVIWWTLLVVVLTYSSSLLKLPKVWRLGLLFMIINNIIAYRIGRVIQKKGLSRWWLLLLPAIFVLVVLSHYAKYNLILAISYLILELLGLIHDNFYKDPNKGRAF